MIYKYILDEDILIKEQVILLAKQKKYEQAFSICLTKAADVDFALIVAHKAYTWFEDKSIFYHLFV